MPARASAVPSDELGLGKAFMEVAAQMLANPARLAESQMNLWWDYMNLWQGSMLKLMGGATEPIAIPAQGDKRFKHEDWHEHFLFDYIKQSYLITSRWLHDEVANVEGLDEHTKKKVNFFTRQYIDALAPSNFALTNPEVYRETIASGGQNLVKGLHNLLDDIERGNGKLKISMTDTKAFELGVNIATTPGKVVFQNDLMQLIQYEPATKKQWKRPLLVIPPWINKYYILDLREKNSFLRWAAGEGLTVFVISWVNPDEKLAHKNFEDYVTEGLLAALDAIEKATGEKDVNAIGYCLGGTLLAATLAWLAAKKQKRIATATFMTSLIDFTAAGELEVFIDEEQVSSLEKKMNERGYLEGSEMAGTFNMLRANDLIWSFVINNYLLGRDPFPFDLLHWNCDSTRMPAAMHSFYLRNLYMKNLLRVPGGITLDGVRSTCPRLPCRRTSCPRSRTISRPGRPPMRGAAAEGQGEVRAVRLRAYRRHDQSAGSQQVRLLDEREIAGGRRRLVRWHEAERRLMVDRLAQVGRAEPWPRSPGTGAGQGQAQGHRAGAGSYARIRADGR